MFDNLDIEAMLDMLPALTLERLKVQNVGNRRAIESFVASEVRLEKLRGHAGE